MSEVQMVGMAEIKTVRHPHDALIALGLGSCIGVCAFDPEAGIAGLVHIVLPCSGEDKAAPGKFADTAIPQLVGEMLRQGANPHRIRVAMAGGAQLFSFNGSAPHLDIGARNIQATTLALEKAILPVVACDLGGNTGRSIHFYGDGRVRVKTIGQHERELAMLAREAATASVRDSPLPALYRERRFTVETSAGGN